MKFAIMSDIHCNFVVFTKLVNDALQNGITHFLFLGDLITDGYRGNDIVKLIKELNGISVLGNREKYINNYPIMSKDFNLRINRKSLGYNSLSKETLEYIKKLKEKETIKINNTKILLIHKMNNDYDELINNYDFDICLHGHTHIPKTVVYNKKLFINPGSVGNAFNNYFSYSILEVKEKHIYKVINRKIKINQKLLNEIKKDFENTKYTKENPEWSKLLINTIIYSKDLISKFMENLNKETKDYNLSSEEYNEIFRKKLNVFFDDELH